MVLVGARRSWLAVVLVLGLVGSLLAVGVVPVAAGDGDADFGALYSACVGPAVVSMGWEDVEGLGAEDAVNCLGHYGITSGRSATEYAPGAPVLRWQMALFLSRAMGPAGLVRVVAPDAFSDVDGVSAEARSAINQMAALGIMPGTDGGRFLPNRVVLRSQMALMLDTFLMKAPQLGVGALAGEADEFSAETVVSDDRNFTDIERVTRREYDAIRRMSSWG